MQELFLTIYGKHRTWGSVLGTVIPIRCHDIVIASCKSISCISSIYCTVLEIEKQTTTCSFTTSTGVGGHLCGPLVCHTEMCTYQKTARSLQSKFLIHFHLSKLLFFSIFPTNMIGLPVMKRIPSVLLLSQITLRVCLFSA